MTIFVIWCVTALACAYLISLIRRVPPATTPLAVAPDLPCHKRGYFISRPCSIARRHKAVVANKK